MKVQLIVVQGKPEGKVIPLSGPKFKIGRGETCHLRPNSEQVSREHAEFTLTADTVSVRDLGSRNGTLVNGKATAEPVMLKDRDLVQVGPLTFAVSIQGAPAAASPAAAAPAAKGSPDDVGQEDIDSWLVGEQNKPAPERPSGIYAGDTMTIAAFKDADTPKEAAAEDEGSDEEYERQPEDDDTDEVGTPDDEMPEEFIDESNPFYVKKKPAEPEGPKKPVYKDTSDAASDILRKMMERRRSR
jgi:predicted component of type VI protein secretion system